MRASVFVLLMGTGFVLSGVLPATAQDFVRVEDRGDFVGLLAGKSLTRLGISLDVTDDGAISGSAFGRTVKGAWDWQDAFFCRDLSYGSTVLEPNCQTVLVKGDVVRFIADRGEGEFADLRLR